MGEKFIIIELTVGYLKLNLFKAPDYKTAENQQVWGI